MIFVIVIIITIIIIIQNLWLITRMTTWTKLFFTYVYTYLHLHLFLYVSMVVPLHAEAWDASFGGSGVGW